MLKQDKSKEDVLKVHSLKWLEYLSREMVDSLLLTKRFFKREDVTQVTIALNDDMLCWMLLYICSMCLLIIQCIKGIINYIWYERCMINDERHEMMYTCENI